MSDEWAKLLMRDHEITEKVLEAGARALAVPERHIHPRRTVLVTEPAR